MEKRTSRLIRLRDLFVKAFKTWKDKDPFKESAVIAYYAIFSLPGLLMIVVSIAGMVYGVEAIRGQLSEEIGATMGGDTGKQVEDIIASAALEGKTVIATIIGIATLVFGATGVFAQFQKALNIIWEVKADTKKSGIWTTIRVRLFSLGLVVSVAFLLLISLVISSILTALGDMVSQSWPDAIMFLFQVLNFAVSLAVIGLLFALMFKFLPDAKVRWRDVWVGSLVTSILFQLGKTALALYFGKADPASGYGAAGSIILILLWVSYTSMIVLFGAEFTRVYADTHGTTPPKETAVAAPDREY